MPDSQIDEIKNKLNVLDIVGSYVKLTKTGINYRGICPFHSEKGPSFFVSPTRQMWKCFGCGKGGDIFAFIKEIEGVEFGDALKILADKAGIVLKRASPQLQTERQRLYEICELSCSFFQKQLGNSSFGKEAKEYLLKRGIFEDSIKKWRLGYSPDTWQGLSDFLVGRGYDRQEIVKAGLAVQSEKGKNPYDRFRGRIIFPIFDANSQVIGFGARIFKQSQQKETAKYINTPQTLLYDKSNVLYGINNAKVAIRKNNQCVLTEGYTDAIMAHQAGFENTVAVSGTALTDRHLNLLKRYTDNLLLSFDMDLAGDNATKRGINLAESSGFNIKIINSYAEKDPADIIAEDPKIWEKSVKEARTIMDYYFDSSFAKFDKSNPEGKKEIGKVILPAIKRLQNKIEQSFWAQKLAEMLGVKEEAVLEELNAVKVENHVLQQEPVMAKIGSKIPPRKQLLEEKTLSLLVKSPENLNLIAEESYLYFGDQAKTFLANMKSGAEQDKDFSDSLALRADFEDIQDVPAEIQLCLVHLKDIYIRDSLAKISQEIKMAEKEKNEQKVEFLKNEFNKISKQLS